MRVVFEEERGCRLPDEELTYRPNTRPDRSTNWGRRCWNAAEVIVAPECLFEANGCHLVMVRAKECACAAGRRTNP